MHKFEIGRQAADAVTGFAGTITAICLSYGSARYQIEAPAGSTDTSQQKGQSEWFDEPRLIYAEGAAEGPGEMIRALKALVEEQETSIATLQTLLDATKCFCTLKEKCPQHDPRRPNND